MIFWQQTLSILEISYEIVGFAIAEIRQIVAVGIGFAFEGDVSVSFNPCAVLKPTNAQFNQIKDIEGNK